MATDGTTRTGGTRGNDMADEREHQRTPRAVSKRWRTWLRVSLAVLLIAAPLCWGARAHWRYAHGYLTTTVEYREVSCGDHGCWARWRVPGQHRVVGGFVNGAAFEWEEEYVEAGNRIWVSDEGVGYTVEASPRTVMTRGYFAAGFATLVVLVLWARRHGVFGAGRRDRT